jgi:hypothetical protein
MARETWLERNFTLVAISVALLVFVAAEHPEVGSLTIHANGVILTVPADSAQAHGNGDIDEEAFFETVRFDSTDS